MLYEVHTTIAAVALAACWAAEGAIPVIRRAGVGAARTRHLILAAINAIPGIGVAAALAATDANTRFFGDGLLDRASLPLWANALAAFLILDFCQYAGHVLMHKVPLLWRIHAVHHHAEHLESTTAFRFHTLEVLVQGMLLIPIVLLLGVRVHDIVIYNAVLLPISMFHHANMKLPDRTDRLLGLVIVTPGLHRMHHSRWQPQTDSNYSAVLSIWDRALGTMTRSARPESIPIGLDGFGPEHTTTLLGMLATPFSRARAGLGTPPVPPGNGQSLEAKPLKAAADRPAPAHPDRARPDAARPAPEAQLRDSCNGPTRARV